MIKHICNRLGLPYTPFVTLVGLIVGLTDLTLDATLASWLNLHPHFILFLFLPALIFESSVNCDWYIFRRQLFKILMLAGPALVISVTLTAMTMYYLLDPEHILDVTQCLIFGSIAAATDPIAVVALLKEVGADKKLNTLIEGESLLNDGTAMVSFLIFLKIAEGNEPTFGSVTTQFVQLSIGGPLIGLLFAILLTWWLNRIHN